MNIFAQNSKLTNLLKIELLFFLALFSLSVYIQYINSLYLGIFIPLSFFVFMFIFLLYVHFVSSQKQLRLNFLIFIISVVGYLIFYTSHNVYFDFWRLPVSGLIALLGFWFFSRTFIILLGFATLIILDIIYFYDFNIYLKLTIYAHFVLLYLLSFGLFYFDKLTLKKIAREQNKNNIDGIYTTDFFYKHVNAQFLRAKLVRKSDYFISVEFVSSKKRIVRNILLSYIDFIKSIAETNEFIFKIERTKLIICHLGANESQINARQKDIQHIMHKFNNKNIQLLFSIKKLDYRDENLDKFFAQLKN